MKKLVMMGLIVPLGMLVAFASVSMAADEPATQELNQELNKDLNGDTGEDANAPQGQDSRSPAPALDRDLTGDDTELNDRNTREARSLAAKRGRQPRRGSTPQVLPDQQADWGDNKSGDDPSGDPDDEDEAPDEDEEPDVTPQGN